MASNIKIWVAPTITITVAVAYGLDPTGETTSNFGFYYSLSSNGSTYGSDILIAEGQYITTECPSWVINVPQNYYGAFGFKKISDNSGRYYSKNESASCPAQDLDYCGTTGTGDFPYTTSWTTSNISRGFTIYVNKAGAFEGC